jgi:hypothetical protein
MEKLDFSALEKLNLPPIDMKASDLEPVTSGSLRGLDKEEIIEDAKESAIEEIENIDEFSTPSEASEVSETDGEEKEEKKQTSQDSEDEDLEDFESGQDSSEETSVVKAVAEWAKAKGLFDYEEDKFEDSEDWLETKLVEKSKEYTQEWVDSLPPVIKEIISNYEEGVPLDELVYSKSREIEYNAVDENELEKSEGLQKKLVSDWLYTQEFSEEEIETKLKKYEDALILEDEAKTALKKLRAYESKYQEQLKFQTQQKQEAARQNYETYMKKIETDIMNSQEIIPDIPVSKEDRKKLYDAYTKADSKGDTALTRAIKSDPQAWYKITQFMVLMNGNLKNVEKSLQKKATEKLKKSVTTYKETPGLNKLTSPAALKAMKKALEKSKKQY